MNKEFLSTIAMILVKVADKFTEALERAHLSPEDTDYVKQLYDRIESKNKTKYVTYLLKYFKEHDIVELINEFDRRYARLQQKDINQYKIEGLREALRLSSEVKTKTEIKSEGAKKVFENAKVRVYHILNSTASCLYGAGTKWCTTAETNNMFNYYHVGHNLYYILSKYREPFNKETLTGDPLYKAALIIDAKGKKIVYDSKDKVVPISSISNEGIPGVGPDEQE